MNGSRHAWVIGLAALSLTTTAHACEPIYPFMAAVGGPGMLTKSWMVLLAAISLKAVLFAAWQHRLNFFHAFGLMIFANGATTVIGFLAGAMLASGPILVVGVFIVWGLCVIPARRLVSAGRISWLGHFSPRTVAAIM